MARSTARRVPLPDGSTAIVRPLDAPTGGALVCREVDGRTVWGQAFQASDQTATEDAVIARMTDDPAAFTR